MKRFLQYTFFMLVVATAISCKKDIDALKKPEEPVWVTQTITPEGGNIQINSDVKLVFPKGAVGESTEITVGYSGEESTSIPNPYFEVIGKPFTIETTVDSFLEDVLIEISKPSGYTKAEQIGIFIRNGDKFFPLFWEESENKLIARLHYVDFEKIYNSKISGNARIGFISTEIAINILRRKQTPPPSIEMGVNRVIPNSGQLLFSELPTLSHSDKILLMVHGWTSQPSDAWSEFLNKIEPQIDISGYTHYLTFGYDTRKGIDENGEILANFLKNLPNGASVDIIGHSMGGLVARSAIENHQSSKFVKNLITIGTPHKGAELALIQYFLGTQIALNNPVQLIGYSKNTKGLRDLNISSSFLNNLNKNPLPLFTNYYPIASVGANENGDGIVSKKSALGIQGNESFKKGKTFPIDERISHTIQTRYDPIIQHIAEQLNTYNKDAFLNSDLSYGNITDIDGNKYATIQIGSQTWMAENLKTTKYNDGTTIPNITNNTAWSNSSSDAWSYYTNEPLHNEKYGKLYNWYAVNTGKLCPQGWHIPTDADWNELEFSQGLPHSEAEEHGWRGAIQNTGGKLKSERGWKTNGIASNQSGFSALPGGYRHSNGTFNNISLNGLWWSSTENTTDIAWARNLYHNRNDVDRGVDPKGYGYSCRCVKD